MTNRQLPIPEGTEASDSIETMSRNYLYVPADIELLPRIMAGAADTSAWVRAKSACRLAQYPVDGRRTLLRLLHDDSTILWGDRKVPVHPVSAAAFSALRSIGVDVPPPPHYEQESRLLSGFFSCSP